MSLSSDTMFRDIYGNILESGDKVLMAKGGVMCETIILYYTDNSMCISWYSPRLDIELQEMIKRKVDYNTRYEHIRSRKAFCKYHNSKIYLKSTYKQYFNKIFYLLDRNINNIPEHLRILIKKNG